MWVSCREQPDWSRGATRLPAETIDGVSRYDGPVTRFALRVVAAVRRVPPGRVATYGDIARLAGSPRAWRAVGNLMAACADPSVPCHRVVSAGGKVGGYGGQEALRRGLLRAEGLIVVGNQIRSFRAVRWPGGEGVSPKD